MKIYTKTGDKGYTSLVGGSRIKKSHLKLDAYGTIDELNSWIGMIRSNVKSLDIDVLLNSIQCKLFDIGSELATEAKEEGEEKVTACKSSDITLLEEQIDLMNESIEPMTNFILPGGSSEISYCHLGRTVCRRAERIIYALQELEPVDTLLLKYINRLSDYLFTLARFVAKKQEIDEIKWISSK